MNGRGRRGRAARVRPYVLRCRLSEVAYEAAGVAVPSSAATQFAPAPYRVSAREQTPTTAGVW